MKCSIGDKIRFLSDVGGGTIVGFVDQYIALVRDEDGFDIPTPISELIVIKDEKSYESVKSTEESSHTQRENSTSNIHINNNITENRINLAPKPIVEKDSDGNEFELSLGFVPISKDNPTESDLQLYLINDSSYRLFYTIGKWDKDKLLPLQHGELEADSKEFIKVLAKQEISEIPILHISFLLFKNRDYEPQALEQINFEINPLKFYKKGVFVENDYFDDDAYIYILTSSKKTLKDYMPKLSPKDLANAMKEKKDHKPKKTNTANDKEVEEVDLHIEELVDNFSGMSNSEILQIQIDKFTMTLDLGIATKTKRMVFIHGVGAGKLKQEIRRLLNTQYAGKVTYNDASFKEYGYGATIVYVK